MTQTQPISKPRRYRSGAMGMVLAVAAVVVLVLLALVAASYHLIFRRPLPRTRGTIAIDGPGAPLEIRRDRWGVPQIVAVDRRDAAFAMGFVHAQDRLSQMELPRRIAAGRLSEI